MDSRGSSGRWASGDESGRPARRRPGGGGGGGVRPVSRRGLREHTAAALADHSRSAAMMPDSAYRGGGGGGGGPASRAGTAGFGMMPVTASKTPAMAGFAPMDRPLTQGFSGLRTATTPGFKSRQLQDKRYWEEVLQHKIREMKAEIGRLGEEVETRERERSAKRHYEGRVKELAQELTDLQGRLSDYNTAIRMSTGEISRDDVDQQARTLKEANEKRAQEVEEVFLEKQRKEMQLKQILEQIEKERSSIAHILSEMSAEQRELYEELESKASGLREEVDTIGGRLTQLNAEKEQLQRDVAQSQIKVHMVELHKRLAAADDKRNNLKKEMTSQRNPQEEREQLLAQVREDNAVITSMDSNSSSLKEQIKKVQELIEQAEQDLEEGNSERHQKYRELRKREETMENFMSTYDESLKKEQEKIEQLENDVVFALEHTSSNIDLNLGEIETLKQREGYASDINTVEELKTEYERLTANLKKAESTRERLLIELQTLPDKCNAMEEELQTLSDIDRLREEGAEQKKALETELEQIKEKLAPTNNAVLEASSKLKALEASLNDNDMYGRLVALQEQLARGEARRGVLAGDLAACRPPAEQPARARALQRVAALNRQLVDQLASDTKSF